MKTAGMDQPWDDLPEQQQVRAAASTVHRRFSGGPWNWFALRGVASLIAGLVLLFFAFSPFLLVTLLLATFLAIDGIFSIGAGLDGVRTIDGRSSARVLRGTVGLISSLILLLLALFGSSTGMAVFMLLALWAIAAGSLDFAVAVHATQRLRVEWLAAGAGLLWVLGGAALPLIALSSTASAEHAIVLLLAILLLATGLLFAGHSLGFDRRGGASS